MIRVESAILRTLAYSDVFDFPLSKNELWDFLISSEKISEKAFQDGLEILRKNKLNFKNGFYCLSGRERIIAERLKHAKEVEKKMKIAKKAADLLSVIPNILLIGISGGLAVGDAKEIDDIDFFIITKRNKVYATRLWILLLLEILGLRRRRFDNHPADKVCVNLLIDETSLAWPVIKRDLYTAHEVMQLKPLFDRKNIYEKFMKENNWIEQYFPNLRKIKNNHLSDRYNKTFIKKLLSIIINISSYEKVFRKLQIYYMKGPKVHKQVTNTSLAFYPNDYRVHTLKLLNLKLQELGLLTKS